MDNILFTLETNTFKVALDRNISGVDSYAAKIEDGVLRIKVPENISFGDTKFKNKILPGIIKHFLKIEAQRKLPGRLRLLAEERGFCFKRISVKEMTSRWGSCSSRGDISLSLFLMLMPDDLIDSVLIHELCHLREMNHGAKFKALLREYVPDIAAKQQRIKKYSSLIRMFKD